MGIVDENDLLNLERRVDDLISTLEQLKRENGSLRDSQSTLLKERTKLIEKTETARARVEAMIERLKAMEEEG